MRRFFAVMLVAHSSAFEVAHSSAFEVAHSSAFEVLRPLLAQVPLFSPVLDRLDDPRAACFAKTFAVLVDARILDVEREFRGRTGFTPLLHAIARAARELEWVPAVLLVRIMAVCAGQRRGIRVGFK